MARSLNLARLSLETAVHVPTCFNEKLHSEISTNHLIEIPCRMVTNTRLPIGIDRHCMAGNNAHWLMVRGYNTGATDFVGRQIDTLQATVSACVIVV